MCGCGYRLLLSRFLLVGASEECLLNDGQRIFVVATIDEYFGPLAPDVDVLLDVLVDDLSALTDDLIAAATISLVPVESAVLDPKDEWTAKYQRSLRRPISAFKGSMTSSASLKVLSTMRSSFLKSLTRLSHSLTFCLFCLS